MKKIFIQGNTGSGKTSFYLPEIIKLLSPLVTNIYKITNEELRSENHNNKHWNNIKFSEYDFDLVTKNDLIFCDEIGFIKDDSLKYILDTHPFIILSSQEPIRYYKWIDENKFTIIKSECIQKQNFIEKFINNKSKSKIRELTQIIK